MTSSSSSSTLSFPAPSLSRNWEHDVFPSFHGPDVRKSFLSHVRKEFRRKAINLFIDNNIKRGEFIGPELERAIRGSKIAVVFLSKNYASSSWCLNELVEIMRKESGQIVLTIFYEVDPTDVKKQMGDFGEVFKNTCQGKDIKKTEIWRKALEEVATIAGYHSSKWNDEALMIEDITADIFKMLNHLIPSNDFKHLIGMRDHMEKMEQLLRLDLDEKRMIGIWGPPGIGKTTIARFLFDQISSEFQHSAIMVNVKESYPKPCLDEYDAKYNLHSQMLSLMTNEKDINISHSGVVQARLGDKKVLLVLDDVDQSGQLNALAQNDYFGLKSRIIITTENRRLLEAHGVVHIYKVNYPSIDEALQMFCTYAFDQKYPEDGFDELSREITYLVGKLPLALKVMGSHFRGLSKKQWSAEIPRLWTNLNGEIESVLKFSYDDLCDEDKDLFLHIACFFNNAYMEKVEAYLAESFTNVRQGLHVLAEKSLISIEYDRRICMHNLLAQLGIDIVRKQSVHEPGQRQFLVDGKDIHEVLNDCRAITKSVIGIDSQDGFDTTKKTFEGISSIRFLRVGYDFRKTISISSLPPKLRLLDWECLQVKCLPFTINLEFLVELRMRRSKLKKLWDGIKLLPNLKWMDLEESRNLKKLPNLSMATNLQELNLRDCSGLKELSSSIGNLTNLKRLDLAGCSSLVKLPSSIGNATNLQELILDNCTTLVKLPSSIGNLHKLSRLSLRWCLKLKTLPININMESLDILDLFHCSLLKSFPEISTNVKSLNLIGTSVKDVPFSVSSWSRLNDLRMPYCVNLKEVPFIHNIISKLHSRDDPTIQELGPWIRGLSCLNTLVLEGILKLVSLPQLPDSLRSLNLNGCSSLLLLPQLPDSLESLYLTGCSSLVSLPQLPNYLRDLDLNGCSNLVSLPQLPNYLNNLNLYGCSSLVSLPQLSDFLRSLDLNGCSILVSLPQLPDSLRSLNLNGCSSLVSLPQLPKIHITFANCFKLNQEARDLIIHRSPTRTRDYAVLPGKEVPECFTYRAYGNSVTVKLNQNPLPTSTKFKACILFDDKRKNSVPKRKPVCCSITSKIIIDWKEYIVKLYTWVTDHLYIFEFEAKEVTSTELVVEFKDKYSKIKECGVFHL